MKPMNQWCIPTAKCSRRANTFRIWAQQGKEILQKARKRWKPKIASKKEREFLKNLK
jgi:hypothetical protein